MRRLIWIGFDGASPGFFRKFMAEGRLPTFETLVRTGVFSESLPIPPCDTPTNWSVLQTGAHTGTTEVVSFFTHRPGEPLNLAHTTLHSGAVRAELVWEAAERQGRRGILLNWPCSWPSRLKQSIQVNGTGPFTASWRISFGRVYRQGQLGGRTLDPAILKLVGGLVDDVRLAPAAPWQNAPASRQPALETTIALLGAERFRWSETGMQIDAAGSGAATADPDFRTYHVLLVDSAGQGYDRALVARARDAGTAIADLRLGQWSGWISERFSQDKVLQQLVPIQEERVEGVFRLKLLQLSPDGRTFGLYRTDIWQAEGWAQPPHVAHELREVVGPFTEGLELPPPPSRVFDEWGTYHEQLDQAREWYVGAARHLTRRYPWEILAVQLHIQDGINHIVARDICPEAPGYTPEKAAKAWAQIEAAYTTSDRLVGEVIEACADADTLVCVVSDHGALPTFRQCLVSGALARAGLMSYARDAASGRWHVDWSQTKVFPRRGHVWVNLRGRDPQGIVGPEEYERVREQAIRALLGIYDEERRTQPILIAVRKEDAVSFGQWGDAVGDIITFMAPLYADSDADYASLPSDPLSTPDVGPTDLGCAHHPYLPSAAYGIWSNPAVFFLSGPGVRRGYERPHPITQADVAPTLCHLLGIAPPAQCEGKIVTDVLEP
ncbi:MAG: alkaline phosphatase family protein [Candidatus Rokubacteria bacterium]|nr:alkaline phosphatase family protein [Candidatus Rokubacteria bacterium]